MARVKLKIFITGGGGFVGKNLLEQLGKKYIVYAPTRRQLDLLNEKQVDLFFKKHKIDVVIHTAVVGGSRNEESVDHALQGNLKMLIHLLNHSGEYKRAIFLGSGAEYDKRKPILKISEDQFGKRIPDDEYGFSKYVCSKLIENTTNWVSLRIFGLFGKYEDYRYRFISNAICQCISKDRITIRKNVYFDYVYINDFVKIIEHFINVKQTKYKFYNIGTGQKVDIKALAKEIIIKHNNPTQLVVTIPGLNNEYTCNNKRLMQEIPKLVFTNRKVAIAELYDWYKIQKVRLT